MPIDPITAGLAVKGGGMLLDKLGGLFGGGKSDEDKAAENFEANKAAFDLQEAQRLSASEVAHGNSEGSRTNRASALGDALGRFSGDFSLSDEVRQNAGQTRGFEDYKREYIPGDPGAGAAQSSKGADFVSGIADIADQGATAYLKGLGPDGGDENAGGGGEFGGEDVVDPRSLGSFKPEAVNPLGGDQFKAPTNCPPGMIC